MPRVEAAEEAADAATLAGGVAALKQHDEPLLVLLDVVLQLDELELQSQKLLLVVLLLELLVIGIAARAQGFVLDLRGQLGIVEVEAEAFAPFAALGVVHGVVPVIRC